MTSILSNDSEVYPASAETWKRVLVIEDEPLVCEVLAETLSEDGFEVSFASNGPDGLALALREPPDAIVIDLMLPRMSGFEVIKTLRGQHRTKSLPIVVTTGRSIPSDKKRAFDLGADEFFLKPYELSALRATLGRLLRRSIEAEV